MAFFYCKSCELKFDAEGTRQEWIDSAFGPCSKIVSTCFSCGSECNEYQSPKISKSNTNNYSTPSCGMGGCCGCGR